MREASDPRQIADCRALARTRRAMLLLERHGRALRRTSRRYSSSPEDAEDALQRAIEILLTKAPAEPAGALIGWMQVVVRREAVAIARARGRAASRRAMSIGSGAEPTPVDPGDPPAPGPGPYASAERRERVAAAAALLARLKPQERRALALQAAGCSYADIQAITGWTYTKVNRCLAEGRASLRGLGQPPEAS